MEKPLTIGPYQLHQELGRGKHTIVYRATQVTLGRTVAIKVLRQRSPDALKKFQAEVRLSAQLNHPGVRRIHDAGQTPDGYPYVVMEYVEHSLRDVLRERQAQRQPFTREEVVRLLQPITAALDNIHAQGLVHLDIKPENILVFADGHAVLADFGSVRRRDETTGEGTPPYTSPEQAAGDRPVGPWSDVYSLGVLLYEMLTGSVPFQGESDIVLLRQHLQDAPAPLRERNPHLDRALERVVLSALNKAPHLRPAGAGVLLHEVQERHSTPLEIAVATVQERPHLALIAAGALVLMILLALFIGGVLRLPSFTAATASPTSQAPPTPQAAKPSATPAPPLEATAIPTLTPTRALNPTSTPAPKPPTATRVSGTPTPACVPEPPTLRAPVGSVVVTITKIEFRWEGTLCPHQTYAVRLRNTSNTDPKCAAKSLVSPPLTDSPWVKELSGSCYGDWQWEVVVKQGEEIITQSETGYFNFHL